MSAKAARLVGVGVFVIAGALLFAIGLFMIGDRQMAFAKKFTVYTEFKKITGLQPGSIVRVSGAKAGSITQILSAPILQTTAQRILLVTYYVDNVSTPGSPRLARRINAAAGQALAGVVEDLDLSFDLVDGAINPVAQKNVPVTIGGVLYTPNQIRKANVHVGVRSEERSVKQGDYTRNHLTTVVSLRSLAYVDRYK